MRNNLIVSCAELNNNNNNNKQTIMMALQWIQVECLTVLVVAFVATVGLIALLGELTAIARR